MTSVVHKILDALVQEWGFEHVSRCLDEAVENGSSGRRDKIPPPRTHVRQNKITASDQVEKLDIEEPKKVLLSEIAKRFDEKTFLPRLGDVRHFLEMKGQALKAPKQRPDAFRAVLKVLEAMPAEGVQRVLKDRSHNGPSRLGPLSRAINQAGTAKNTGSTTDEQSATANEQLSGGFTHPSSTPR